jgi:serine/threonine-protein kinase
MDGDPFGLLGVVLDGTFRVDALVGEGELSVIYRGYHLAVETPVAIKCLHLPDTLDPALTRPVVEAFEDAGRLHDRFGQGNPHVAQTIAAGRTKAPRTGVTVPYRVREWFDGESLASQLARRRRQGSKPPTVEEALALLAPAIDGIARAHEQGLSHLSLDPGNLFLCRDEGPYSLKVLDFGTARARHRADARPTLDSEVTRGLHLFHPAYAAPEQLDMDLGEAGPWSDVYALALILMEVLAERSDVDRGNTAALVRRALDKEKRPTPQAHGLKLPPGLDEVLTRAVARSPENRQKNARIFLNELKAALGQRAAAKAPALRAATQRFVVRPVPTKLPKPPVPAKVSLEPARTQAIEEAPVVFVPPAPLTPASPQPQAPPLSLSPPPQAPPLPPAAAVSGPIVATSGAEDPLPAPIASPPSVLPPVLAPVLLDAEEKLVRRRLSSRVLLGLRIGAAALAVAAVVGGFVGLARGRRPSARLSAPPPTVAAAIVAASPVTPVARSGATPLALPAAPAAAIAAAPVTPSVAPPLAAAAVEPTAPAANPHPASRASVVRFSLTAAQHALHSVTRRVERCRRGQYWGNGYATVVFWNDGSVHQVLVDPPFSMTVAGKCVADALRTAHMRSFVGRIGYYRLRFYIAPH